MPFFFTYNGLPESSLVQCRLRSYTAGVRCELVATEAEGAGVALEEAVSEWPRLIALAAETIQGLLDAEEELLGSEAVAAAAAAAEWNGVKLKLRDAYDLDLAALRRHRDAIQAWRAYRGPPPPTPPPPQPMPPLPHFPLLFHHLPQPLTPPEWPVAKLPATAEVAEEDEELAAAERIVRDFLAEGANDHQVLHTAATVLRILKVPCPTPASYSYRSCG